MAGTSYTRQSTLTDGDTITASLFNAEYNQLVSAFSYAASATTGHQHDGSAGEGGNIHTIGDQDFNNKIVVDSTNNRWSVFVEVGGTAVEQVRIEDGVVYPVTDSDVDLGTDTLRFKNAYIDSLTATGNLTVGGNITVTGNVDVDGIVEFDGLSGTGAVTVTDILDQDDMSGDSATALATQQSIKAYVDAQVTAQDLDLTDGTTTIAIDLDSEALSVLGGTGVTSTASGNGVTLAIDSTVTTLTGTQTLTNKTLTSPDVNTPDIDGGTIDGTVIGGTTAAAGSFTTVGATGNITVGGTVDGRDVAADGTKLDGIESAATADQTDAEIRTAVEAASDSNVFTDADHTKLNAIEALADVTDTANVTAAGALMDSELTSIASVKALDQGVATTDSPQFVGITSTSNVIVGGNLTVNGTTTTLNTATLDVEDKNITINYGAGDTTGSANGAGITIQDAVDVSTDATILWDTTNDEFDFSHPINVAGKVTSTGTSVFASLDISGDIDVDGVTNLDATNIVGALDVTGTATMDGLTVSNSTTNAYKAAIVESAHPTTDAGILFIGGGDNEFGLQQPYNAAGLFFYDRTNGAKRLDIGSGGDISFYEDTGTTAKLFWDASAESLGIGTSSPPHNLSVNSSSTGIISVGDFTGDNVKTYIEADQTNNVAKINSRNNHPLAFSVHNTERMRIDSSGKVSIGSLSTAGGSLGVNHAIAGTYPKASGIGLGATSTAYTVASNGGTVSFTGGAGLYAENTASSGNPTNLVFWTNSAGTPAEAMRIDASGNLLVGKSATAYGTAGVVAYANGGFTATKSADAPVGLNRLSSDGSIINFAKDGTTVGSIGAAFGFLSIGNADTGLLFDGTSDTIKPWNVSNTSARDAAIDLGGSTDRFRDLYLSGGAASGTSSNFLRFLHDGNNGIIDNTTGSLVFRRSGFAESMRIDSSGNLLVGTTDTDPSNNGAGGDAGHAFSSTGYISSARSGGTVALFNRMDSDGDIAAFRKDGVVVGTIGTSSGYTKITSGDGTNGSGLQFGDSKIYPVEANSVVTDNAVDFGDSNYRFKDLYLSGTATMGGLTVNAGTDKIVLANNFATTGNTDSPKLAFYSFGDVATYPVSGPSIKKVNTGSYGAGDLVIYQHGPTDFTNEVEVLRISSAGNVGIGNTVASSMDGGANNLVIGSGSGTEGMTIYSGTTNSGTIYFADGASGDDRFRGQINYAHSDNSLNFRTNASSTPSMTINSAGLVAVKGSGAGSVSDHFRIESSDTDSKLAFVNTTGNGAIVQSGGDMRFMSNTANTERMRINSSGNVLVGCTSPLSFGSGTTEGVVLEPNALVASRANVAPLFLQRSGSDGQIANFYRDTSSVGSISVDATSTTYTTTSDRRLKKDIETITDGTDKLMAMNPVTHGWKADPEADAVHGFIAQEMLDIVPEAVSGDPEGEDMMSMDYGRITPVIVAALQEANKKIMELENRINELEGK